jgi:hypothetical protein
MSLNSFEIVYRMGYRMGYRIQQKKEKNKFHSSSTPINREEEN